LKVTAIASRDGSTRLLPKGRGREQAHKQLATNITSEKELEKEGQLLLKFSLSVANKGCGYKPQCDVIEEKQQQNTGQREGNLISLYRGPNWR